MALMLELAFAILASVLGLLWCFTRDASLEPFMATAGVAATLLAVAADAWRRLGKSGPADATGAADRGRGGRGGSASVGGSGVAIGGTGGGSGAGGNGGDGGGAHIDGDGIAVGGEGGEAGQADRGGRGGRSGYDLYREAMGGRLPLDAFIPPGAGRGGNGGGPAEQPSDHRGTIRGTGADS